MGTVKGTILDRSRDKLSRESETEIIKLFEQVLDYAQVACQTKDTYTVLRSKILRVGNNCIRNVKKNLQHYNIEYVPQIEEIVEVKQSN